MADGTERTEQSRMSEGPGETEALAAAIAAGLGAGDVVLISGGLGAGKTTFVRGACRALGIEGPVTSPTFTLGRLYPREGAPDLAHLDLYRLGSLDEEEPGLLDDYVNATTISFVEWPAVALGEGGASDRELSGARYEIELEHAGRDQRRIRIRETGSS